MTTGCSKKLNENYFSSANVVVGQIKSTTLSNKISEIQIGFRIISNYNNEALLPQPLFTIEDSRYIIANDSTTEFCDVSYQSLVVENEGKAPISLFVLFDKSNKFTFNDFYEYKLVSFREALAKLLNNRNNIKINMAICADSNKYIDRVQLFSEFFTNINSISTKDFAIAVDKAANLGNANLSFAVDSILNYFSKQQINTKRTLLIFTDYSSGFENMTILNKLVEKANRNNVRICFYNTFFPDKLSWSHQICCNRTNGIYFGDIASDVSTNIYRSLTAMTQKLEGQDYYVIKLRIETDNDFFNLQNWAFIRLHIKFYNGQIIQLPIVYEI